MPSLNDHTGDLAFHVGGHLIPIFQHADGSSLSYHDYGYHIPGYSYQIMSDISDNTTDIYRVINANDSSHAPLIM